MQAFNEQIRAENIIFHVAIGIAALLLTTLGFIVVREYTTLPALTEKTTDIAVTVQDVRYYEKKLTHAATVSAYIASSDERWRTEYMESAKGLQAALTKAAGFEKEITGKESIVERIYASSDKLTAHYQEAFHLLKKYRGNGVNAPSLDKNLLSWRKSYNHSLNMLYDLLNGRIKENISAIESATSQKAAVFFLCFVLLLCTWVIAVMLLNRSRSRLFEQYTLLETVVDHLPIAFYTKNVTDPPYVYTRFNRAAEKMFGIPRNNVLQRVDTRVSFEGNVDNFIANDISAIEGDRPVICDEEHIHTSDGVCVARTVRIPVFKCGKASILIGFIQDMTKIRENERQLEHYAECLEQRTAKLLESARFAEEEADKNAFFANISHELRVPMHDIQVASEMGLRYIGNQGDVKLHQCLSNINAGSSRLSQILDDILNVSQSEEVFAHCIQQEDIHDIIRQSAEGALPLLGKKKLTLSVSNSSPFGLLSLDKTRILRVISYLISNAIRFSVVNKRLLLKTSFIAKRNSLSITVTDEGAGINESEEENIFESNDVDNKKLGLPVCRRIIEAHGGTLTVRNRSDGVSGAVFEIILPFERQSLKQGGGINVAKAL